MRAQRTAVEVVGLLVVTVTMVAACSSSPPAAPPRVQAVGGDIALVQTQAGLAGVPVGATEPAWVVPGAVAAPDGSAVFALRPLDRDAEDDERDIVRVDPRTGDMAKVGVVPFSSALRVAAVDPGGDRIALAGPDGPSTRVLDYGPGVGTVPRSRTFEGTVEPEAYSTDGLRLFAARIYGDRYHVHVLELTTGDQHPTFGPDKAQAPEDMYGSAVQAALSPDGRQLATLYRDTSTPDHTAFVHLLSLDDGLTICIDLHAPFGTGPIAADAIEWRSSTVAVGHDPGPDGRAVLATFDTNAWRNGEPQAHYHAEVQEGPAVEAAAPRLPPGVADLPGFRRFVALAPAAPARSS